MYVISCRNGGDESMKCGLEFEEDVGFIRIPGVLDAAFGSVLASAGVGLDSGERPMPISGAGGCASCVGDTAALEAFKIEHFTQLNQSVSRT